VPLLGPAIGLALISVSIAAFITRFLLDKTLLKPEANSNLISPITASIDGIINAARDLADAVAMAPNKEVGVVAGAVLFNYGSLTATNLPGEREGNDEEAPGGLPTPR
jgi:hypothetical protein